jgi:hypothetical protein
MTAIPSPTSPLYVCVTNAIRPLRPGGIGVAEDDNASARTSVATTVAAARGMRPFTGQIVRDAATAVKHCAGEDAARELPNLPLKDAQLVHLYNRARIAEVREGCDALARAIPERRRAQAPGLRGGHHDSREDPNSRATCGIEEREFEAGGVN